MLDLLTRPTPAIALIGLFSKEQATKCVIPITELAKVPYIAPDTPRNELNVQLQPNGSTFVLSMEPGAQTKGREVLDILHYFEWSHIALVITSGRGQQMYAQNLESILSDGRLYNVYVVVTVFIPSQRTNGTADDLKDLAVEEMTKVRNSGAKVIVLSIESEASTYSAVFEAAEELGLINRDTAWILLQIPTEKRFFEIIEGVEHLLDGILATRSNLRGTSRQTTVLCVSHKASITSFIPYIYIYIYVSAVDEAQSTLAVPQKEMPYSPIFRDIRSQYTYDAVWAVAFSVQRAIEDGVKLEHKKLSMISSLWLRQWRSGVQLVERMKQQDYRDLSGRVKFDMDGERKSR